MYALVEGFLPGMVHLRWRLLVGATVAAKNADLDFW